MLSRVFLIACLLTITGCASTHFENDPLAQPNTERRSVDIADPNSPVILVAISGGGARASDLGWVVLKELRNYRYKTSDGKSHRLVDDVALVSSVSGGSVIAAYFGLFGPDGLDQFEQDFLARENMKDLIGTAVDPFSWVNLALNGASNISYLEELLDQRMFHRRTFAELNQAGKPFVVLNATDMASGDIFPFTPSRLDDICSNFDNLKISTGVAASAAFPILLSPVALENYSKLPECQKRLLPSWILAGLRGTYGPYINLEEYKRARYANDLRYSPDKFRDIQYLYLLDGGMSDNLGIHSILEAITLPRGTGGFLKLINEGKIRKLVVIVVNARSDVPVSVYQSTDRPSVLKMAQSVASVPIDATTASVNMQMSNLTTELQKVANQQIATAKFSGLEVYNIQIDMDQLHADNAQQRALRDRAKSIDTSWDIKKEDREVISQVGKLLLRQHPCFQQLAIDMKIDNDFVDPQFAKAGCPTSRNDSVGLESQKHGH